MLQAAGGAAALAGAAGGLAGGLAGVGSHAAPRSGGRGVAGYERPESLQAAQVRPGRGVLGCNSTFR